MASGGIYSSIYIIVRIEFSPMEYINDSNGHYYTLETTDRDQLEATLDISLVFAS